MTATPDDGVIYFQPNVTVDAAGRVAISAFAQANGRMNVVLVIPAGRPAVPDPALPPSASSRL